MGLGMGLCLCVKQTQRLELKLNLKAPKVSGIPGTRKNLCRVLSESPQRYGGSTRYVLAGGWAADLLYDGNGREHHDIDIVVLSPSFKAETDNQKPQSYFGQTSMPSELFRDECVRTLSTRLQITFPNSGGYYDPYGMVEVASPEFLAIGKLSGGWKGQPAREEDLFDATALLRGGFRRQVAPMVERSAQIVFQHLIGLPHKRVSAFVHGFMALSRASYRAPFNVAATHVRAFHEVLKDAIESNRNGGEIVRDD